MVALKLKFLCFLVSDLEDTMEENWAVRCVV